MCIFKCTKVRTARVKHYHVVTPDSEFPGLPGLKYAGIISIHTQKSAKTEIASNCDEQNNLKDKNTTQL